MKKKWNRTPKHIMRRNCIEYVSQNWQPDSFVEFGSGTGDVTQLFLDKGYFGTCYDIGRENRQILSKNLIKYGKQVEIAGDLTLLKPEQFQYLFAFEVLEHIDNDLETLMNWSTYLKSDGIILLSVPAHRKKYSKDDELVGHVRRYEKQELLSLLEKSGYKNIVIFNYGFPLGNITRLASKFIHSAKEYQSLSPLERSIKSGIESNNRTNKLAFLFNNITLLPFNVTQKLFWGKDWGDGYVAFANKR